MTTRVAARASILLLTLGIAVTGCSGFRHDRKVARKASPPPESLEGIWAGRWHSEKNPDHGGEMEMVLTRTGDSLYRASTRSRWWRVFRSAYDTGLVVTPVREGEYLLVGQRNLWGFGNYTLHGRIQSDHLQGTYQVGSETGQVDLKKVKVE